MAAFFNGSGPYTLLARLNDDQWEGNSAIAAKLCLWDSG